MSKRITIPKTINPEAAILIAGQQFVLIARQNGGFVQKVIAPGAVRQAFAAEPIDTGWLPPGINRWGSGPKGVWMVRWHPPRVYPVFLPDRKRSQPIPMPALVFFAQGSKYYIWAMKGEKFDPKAELWNAPCANVSEIGLICWGQNPHPDVASGCFDRQWNMFWEAPFNNNWSNGKSVKHPKGINTLLAELARANAKTYPVEDLTRLQHRLIAGGATLEKVVEAMAMRGVDL